MSVSNEAITWAYTQPVGPSAKFVLVALADMADEGHSCYPGQQKLATMTGHGVRTVRRQLLELEIGGYLRRERRFDASGHRTSDRYVLPVGEKIPSGQSDRRPIRPVAKSTTGQNGQRPDRASLAAIDDSPTGQIGQVSLSEPPEEPTVSRSTRYPAAFEEFWKAYPRHVGKDGAFKVWKTATKRVDVRTIIDGAMRYRDDPNREDEFTAHPSTWLNAGRWNDDRLPAKRAGGNSPEAQAKARIAARAADPLASAR